VDFGRRDSFEVRKYVYGLTPSGERVAGVVRRTFSDFVKDFDERFSILKSTGYHENTKVLSTAAKVKHILFTEKRSLTTKSIQAKAKELGWEISTRDLSASVKVLVGVGLAKTSAK
jgi:hypothetical protein